MRAHYPVILTVIIVFLLISLALNFIFYNKARTYYYQNNLIRLDPLGLTHYPVGTNNIKQKTTVDKRVVLFGDSRSYDWQPPVKTGDFQFINRGISGQTSSQLAGRFVHHIAPLRPDFIVLQLCINDLKVIPLYPGRKEKIIFNCKQNISEIVSKSLNLGSIVILTSIFPLGEIPLARQFFWSDDVSEAIDDVNAYISTFAGPDLYVLDTAAVLADENGIVRREYSRDFLHITSEGYAALNRELLRILNKYQ